MGIMSAIVLFAVIWFLTFLVVLPLRLVTQGEAGEVVPGTHKSAPAEPQVAKKAKITTIAALLIWAVVAGIILSGVVGVEDFDLFNRLSNTAPPENY